MNNSVNQANQLVPIVPTTKFDLPIGEPICKINLSGYSLDNYKTFNPEGYTILCRFGEASDGLNFFPKTSKIILDTGQQSQLINNFDKFIPTVAEDFGIPQQEAYEKAIDFFSNKQVTIEPKGIQGFVYKAMNSAQNCIPVSYTAHAVSLLKTTGMTGVKIIVQAPLTFVGATYIGSIFFGYCGSVTGSNAVGIVCNTASFILSRPMRGVEITLNGLLLRPISNLIGLPLVLNGTQEILNGQGLSIQEYTKIGIAFERIAQSTMVKKVRKIYKIMRSKDA